MVLRFGEPFGCSSFRHLWSCHDARSCGDIAPVRRDGRVRHGREIGGRDHRILHLATTGLSPKRVAGVLGFVGGLGALVIGGSRFVRAARGWHRMLDLPRPRLGSVTPADRSFA